MRVFHFRSDDLDESVSFVERNFGPHTRVPLERGPLGFRISGSIGLRSAAGCTSRGNSTALRATARTVTVHLPLQVGACYRIGRRELRSIPGTAVVLAPGHDYTAESGPGATMAFQIEPSPVEEALYERGLDRRGAQVMRSIELPVSWSERESLLHLVEQHHEAVRNAQRGAGPSAMRNVEHGLASWLADRIMAARGLAALSPSSRVAAERVDAWIRDNYAHPVTLEQLSRVAGVVGRTLQDACKARWGQTPLELVTSRRLERVRAELEGQPGITVTEAAVRSGFTHLGRFSLLYRRAYGESPSETLVRTRVTRSAPAEHAH